MFPLNCFLNTAMFNRIAMYMDVQVPRAHEAHDSMEGGGRANPDARAEERPMNKIHMLFVISRSSRIKCSQCWRRQIPRSPLKVRLEKSAFCHRAHIS